MQSEQGYNQLNQHRVKDSGERGIEVEVGIEREVGIEVLREMMREGSLIGILRIDRTWLLIELMVRV